MPETVGQHYFFYGPIKDTLSLMPGMQYQWLERCFKVMLTFLFRKIYKFYHQMLYVNIITKPNIVLTEPYLIC